MLTEKAGRELPIPGQALGRSGGWLVLQDTGILAITKPGAENMCSLISSSESLVNPDEMLRNPQLRSEITVKLQEEAKSYFAGITAWLPEKLLGAIRQTNPWEA